jgi:alanine racemase
MPVVGITGSNGKTIVKEWLYQLLQNKYRVARSPKSYNSQIGVPLSVWQLDNNHEAAIFEAGISRMGEMEKLQPIIRPTIGILTNIGAAHSEGFTNTEEKITEKLQLFNDCDALVYCKDNLQVENQIQAKFKTDLSSNDLKLLCWSRNQANVFLEIVSVTKQTSSTFIEAIHHPNWPQNESDLSENISIEIPFSDEASIENAIHCWCVALYMKMSNESIQHCMQQLRPVEMRLELKSAINNCSLINDSYSADVNSLQIALDFMSQQKQHVTNTVIMSDIMESGQKSAHLYQQVAAILTEKKIDKFIGIGPELMRFNNLFSNISMVHFFPDTASFKQQFHSLSFHKETILLKGARLFEFEQISSLLEQKIHQTVLEINLTSIQHNLKTYQKMLQPGVKTMAMVKAFSYGSGSYEIANLLQFNQVDYLAVAYADEGVELRKAGITLPIMVMSPENAAFENMVQHNLEPELYSAQIFNSFQQYLYQCGIQHYPVHIKIDSGMHRLGFTKEELPDLLHLLKENNPCKIQTVFSHLAASGDRSLDAFTQQQATVFLECCEAIEKTLGYAFLKHIANSSAIHHHPHLQLDMIRLGIGMYGLDAYGPMQQQLKNVTTLKTTIAQIKKVNKGDTVGYDRAGLAKENMLIDTVRRGYADGYARAFSNGKGSMLVNGQLAKVVGKVCMDMTMLDITNTEAKEGDEVIVFGEQLSVNELAKWADTIPYEILTGASQRVKRLYFEE